MGPREPPGSGERRPFTPGSGAACGPGSSAASRSTRKLTARAATSSPHSPPGEWVVLRFGYSLLGITNHPATAEATGLEVDKLNASYVK